MASSAKHAKQHLDFSLVRGVLFSGFVLLIAAVVLLLFSTNMATITISMLLGLTFIAVAVTGALAQVYRYERHAPDNEKDNLTVLSMLSHLIFWR